MTKKRHRAWCAAGLAVVLATAIPCLLLGEDAVFTYHDQLDGELIAYLLQARHLFQGEMLPEFLGGVSKTALTLPAPLFVLFFLPAKGYPALAAMLLIGRSVGYLGMYLLCGEYEKERWICAVSGVLYACLPFLPVYGLSQFGIPMLFWCVIRLYAGEKRAAAFGYVILYGLCSSLVLAGFGLLGAGVLCFLLKVWGVCRKKGVDKEEKKRLLRRLKNPAAAWCLLLGIYLLENFRLLRQMLGNGRLSHKAEYALAPRPFWEAFCNGFWRGGQHSQDRHGWVLGAAALALILWLLCQRRRRERRIYVLFCCLWVNIGICLLCALWESAIGIRFRESLGALGAFQLDRLLWLAPCFWYLAGGCAAGLIWQNLREIGKEVWSRCACAVLAAALAAVWIWILLAGDVKYNVRKLLDADYPMLSFREYYAVGVLEQVKVFLRQETGQEPQDYRVASLGIDPAAALYHGFYCLDGYSNNYPLTYKHAFRRILEPELEKSPYLKEYFDGWGNRCYLFSSECPGYYTIEKNGFFFQNYELNTEAMRELGGEYLLSAAYILNGEKQGLTLMREAPFETRDSYYRIFLYKVEGTRE